MSGAVIADVLARVVAVRDSLDAGDAEEAAAILHGLEDDLAALAAGEGAAE